MDSIVRAFWRLAAVGGAIAVGLTTHDAGFTVLTLFGGLALPRILGLPGARHHGFLWAGGCGRGGGRWSHVEDRLGTWHRQEHGIPSGGTPAAGATQV